MHKTYAWFEIAFSYHFRILELRDQIIVSIFALNHLRVNTLKIKMMVLLNQLGTNSARKKDIFLQVRHDIIFVPKIDPFMYF